MNTITLKDIDAVYAKMCATMSADSRLRYCREIIDLTISYLSGRAMSQNSYRRKMSHQTILAARLEMFQLAFVTNSSSHDTAC